MILSEMMKHLSAVWRLLVVLLVAIGLWPIVGGCGGGGTSGTMGKIYINPTSSETSGTISGNVTASQSLNADIRRPLAGIRPSVGIASAEIWLESNPSLRTSSSANGAFIIANVPFGQYRIVTKYYASGKTWKIRSGYVGITQEKSTGSTGELGLQAASKIVRGILRDTAGNPLANVTLSLWGETFKTDANGTFESPPMPDSVQSEVIKIQNSSLYQNSDFSAPFLSGKYPPTLELTLSAIGDTNRAPMVTLSTSRTDIAPGEQITLIASATDPDTFDLSNHTVIWEKTDGILATSSNKWQAIYTSPSRIGIATVSIRVIDQQGLSGGARLTLSMGGGSVPTNTPPTASLSGTSTVAINNSATYVVSASDFDGDPLSYAWSCNIGSFSAPASSTTLWFSPAYAANALLQCSITDTKGASVVKTLQVTAYQNFTSNRPPTGYISGPLHVALGSSTPLVAQAQDPDGDTITYLWASSVGSFSVIDQPSTIWTAPLTSGNALMRCIFSDSRGEQGVATFSLFVGDEPVNGSPAARISGPAVVFASSTVLSVHAIDPENDPLTYLWTTANGSFSDPGSPNVTWYPGFTGTGTVQCRVSDNHGNFVLVQHVMQVTTSATNHPPSASITASGTIVKGNSTTLRVTATDQDGDPLTFFWIGPGSFSPTLSSSPVTVWTAPILPGAKLITCRAADGRGGVATAQVGINVTSLILSSTGFTNNATMSAPYVGSSGYSPPLSWTGVPATALSLALICDDLDVGVAPNFFVHWTMAGIPASLSNLAENVPTAATFPNGIMQGLNGFGTIGYAGPQPPASSTHHYRFRLYALDNVASLPASFTAADLRTAIQGQILDQKSLTGIYTGP